MVGKRLLDGRGNGCVMSELSNSREDVRPLAEQLRIALRYATLKREANGLPPAPVGSCAQIVPKLSKALAPTRARRGKSAAVEKWLKRQLEFRDEQRMIGSIRDVAPPLGRPSGSASLRGI